MTTRTRIGFLAGCLLVTVLAGPRAAVLAVEAFGEPYAGPSPHETVASSEASAQDAFATDSGEEWSGDVR